MKLYQVPAFQLDYQPLFDLLPLEEHVPSLNSRHDSLKTKFDESIGFHNWPTKITKDALNEITRFASELRNNFEAIIYFGIGGSHLGPAALQQALIGSEETFPYLWLSNIDPNAIERAQQFVKKYRCASVVLSKSGGTLETLAGFYHLSPSLDPNGTVVVTDPEKGYLRDLVNKGVFKHSLGIPPDIGGRFSALTAVGLLPIAISGKSPIKLIEGAARCKEQLDRTPIHENPAYLLALAIFLREATTPSVQYLMPYHSELELLSKWFVQLFGESLGKMGKGPTFASALGTTDQHSLLQLFNEGPKNKLVGFLDYASESTIAVGPPNFPQDPLQPYISQQTFEAITQIACRSTRESLHGAGVPTYHIRLENLSEFSLGSLLFFFQNACAMAGELFDIWAYDQPGVEETKKLMKQALSQPTQ